VSLLAAAYPGTTATWLTERELRAGALAGTLVASPGAGWPDGVLVTTGADGTETLVAVEVERTQKAARLYAPKVAWYRHALAPGRGALVKAVWYCATPAVAEGVRRAIRAGGAEGLPVGVKPFLPAPPDRPVYGVGVTRGPS
jgi:hypothetical protein